MTDQTEKPKIPLKFANYAVQYNKFGSNYPVLLVFPVQLV